MFRRPRAGVCGPSSTHRAHVTRGPRPWACLSLKRLFQNKKNQQLDQALRQRQQQQAQQQGLLQTLTDLPQSLAQRGGAAVAAATNPARASPTLLDTKCLGKPPPLKNTEGEFLIWARRTENFVVSVHQSERCLDVGRGKRVGNGERSERSD